MHVKYNHSLFWFWIWESLQFKRSKAKHFAKTPWDAWFSREIGERREADIQWSVKKENKVLFTERREELLRRDSTGSSYVSSCLYGISKLTFTLTVSFLLQAQRELLLLTVPLAALCLVSLFDRVTIAVAVPSGILQADMCMPQPFLPPSTQRSGCTLPCSGSRKIVQEEELPERVSVNSFSPKP